MHMTNQMLSIASETGYTVYNIDNWASLHSRFSSGLIIDYKAFWDEIHLHKYDGDIYLGDEGNHEFVFRMLELPLIKQMYPEELVAEMVKTWVNYLLSKAKNDKPNKFAKYLEVRRSGLSFKEARKLVGITEGFGNKDELAKKYEMPYRFKYGIASEDADVLHGLGIEAFIRNFYDRFYVPVQGKQNRSAKKRAVEEENEGFGSAYPEAE